VQPSTLTNLLLAVIAAVLIYAAFKGWGTLG
jgi:hypothetical protein